MQVCICVCTFSTQTDQLFREVLLHRYTASYTFTCFSMWKLARMCMPVRVGPPSPPHPVVSGCVTAPLTGSSNALSDLCEIAGLLSAAEDSLETNRLLIPSARGEREGGPWDSYQSTIHHTDRPPQPHPGSQPPPGLPRPCCFSPGESCTPLVDGYGRGGMLEMPVHLFSFLLPFKTNGTLGRECVCLPACVCGGLGGLWCGGENMLRWLGPSRLVLAVRMKVCAGEVEVCHSLLCLQGDVFGVELI